MECSIFQHSHHSHTPTHSTHTHTPTHACCIGVPQLVVLVTDGQDDTDPVRKKATEMKDVDNIHIMTVGFGTLCKSCANTFFVVVVVVVELVCV